MTAGRSLHIAYGSEFHCSKHLEGYQENSSDLCLHLQSRQGSICKYNPRSMYRFPQLDWSDYFCYLIQQNTERVPHLHTLISSGKALLHFSMQGGLVVDMSGCVFSVKLPSRNCTLNKQLPSCLGTRSGWVTGIKTIKIKPLDEKQDNVKN